jgi:hypothetical protein
MYNVGEVFLYRHSMDIMAICFAGAVDSFVVMKSIDLYNLLCGGRGLPTSKPEIERNLIGAERLRYLLQAELIEGVGLGQPLKFQLI